MPLLTELWNTTPLGFPSEHCDGQEAVADDRQLRPTRSRRCESALISSLANNGGDGGGSSEATAGSCVARSRKFAPAYVGSCSAGGEENGRQSLQPAPVPDYSPGLGPLRLPA